MLDLFEGGVARMAVTDWLDRNRNAWFRWEVMRVKRHNSADHHSVGTYHRLTEAVACRDLSDRREVNVDYMYLIRMSTQPSWVIAVWRLRSALTR
jgi:hypothetical protein